MILTSQGNRTTWSIYLTALAPHAHRCLRNRARTGKKTWRISPIIIELQNEIWNQEPFGMLWIAIILVLVQKKSSFPHSKQKLFRQFPSFVKAVIKWCTRTNEKLKMKPQDVGVSTNFEGTQTKGFLVHLMLKLKHKYEYSSWESFLHFNSHFFWWFLSM